MGVVDTNMGLRQQRESAKRIRFEFQSWIDATNVQDAIASLVTGPLQSAPPHSISSTTYVQSSNDGVLVFNGAASCTVTLLSPGAVPGQWLLVKTTVAFTVVSASSNVVPLNGGSAGTAILPATIGKWALLVSDGTNWIIMASN